MKKNAFTLVELIAVIVILSLIALVVFPAVNSTLKDSKEKAYNQQRKTIIKAAKECSYENTFILPEEVETGNSESNSLPLKCLTVGCNYQGREIVGGYLEYDEKTDCESKVVDPNNTEKCLSGSVTITYSADKKQYVYEYNE